jgi:DNA-binding beta-propeller fold protein YncE
MLQHPLRTGAPVIATMRTVLVALALALVVAAAGALCAQPAAAASLPSYLQTYEYLSQFGSHGTADGLLNFPNQIAFGPNGDLYVADTHNARIQEFMTDGMWMSTIGVASQPDWGGGNVGFDQPQGVAVGVDHVWAVDYSYGLAWFGPTGTWQGMSRGPGTPSGSELFGLPGEAAVDGQGNVYVADGGTNHRVVKYDSSGAYVCQITNASLLNPVAVGVNAAGAVFVGDSVGSDILRFAPTNVGATTYALTATWSAGSLLSGPASIALDGAGNVYAGDSGLTQVVKLSPSGKLLARWGSSGAGNGQFTYLLGVAVDPATNNVYVGDRDADRIQSFQLLDLGPKTYASANLTVKKGKPVTFKYGVAEDVSAKATAWIKIKKGATVKGTVNLGSVQCGSWLTRKWTCKLAKGSYRWFVYATDQGGHSQVLVGSKSLTVK